MFLYFLWQKISGFIIQSKEYLVKKAFDKIPSALQMISDALSISKYSDNLMAMKAEALLLVCIYSNHILHSAHHYYILPFH
jgi:DnaJ family protein C protein 7